MGAILFFLPFIWMVFGVFKTSSELTSLHPALFPETWNLDNFIRLFDSVPYGQFYFNSLVVACSATTLVLATSSIAGYIFAKKRFRGREVIFISIIATMMIPFSVTLVPLFIIMIRFKLANTLIAVILPSVAHPFGIYLMRRHIETIPDELIEAAVMDGGSEVWIFTQIIMQLSTASLSALAIFSFMFNWNNYLWPLVVLRDSMKMTLSVGIASLQMQAWTSYDLSVTAGALAVFPVLIVFAFAQRNIVQGLTMTGMKS
jgi:ABC-type glycerol-3-phosphate transport system permease component